MSARRALLVVFVVLSLLAAACGGRDDGDDAESSGTPPSTQAPDAGSPDDTTSSGSESTTSGAPEADPCAAESPEATDIGVTADTITVVVMADVENTAAPGLFQGSVDGVNGWARHVNDAGGLACRDVEVIFADSMLNPTETTNGFLTACENALALVGTTVLFGLDTEDLNTCSDGNGDPIGVPDIAYVTTEHVHQCSENSFHVARPGASCPWGGSGDRDYAVQIGPIRFLQDQATEPLSGVYLVPSELPSTTASAFPQIEAQNSLAADTIALAYGAPGAQTQAEYGDVVQSIREQGLNYVYNGSNDQSIIKLRAEAAAQGLDVDSITWVCSSACYTPSFIEDGNENAENTYVWMGFLPFEEADTNPELTDFMAAIDDPFPAAWAAGAWAAGVLFEDVVNEIVAIEGANGVTRAAVLDGLRAVESFDANGYWGEIDMTTTLTTGRCWVLLQVQAGEYVRVFPEERGTLECSDTASASGDPTAFTPS